MKRDISEKIRAKGKFVFFFAPIERKLKKCQ
jgi:hypothetical protein